MLQRLALAWGMCPMHGDWVEGVRGVVLQAEAVMLREGLVETRPYRSIFLTEAGAEMARKSRERHQIVLGFLLAIGVPKDVAEIDAEGVEHHVSAETLAIFEKIAGEAGKE